MFKNADVYLPLARGYDPRRELDRFVDSLFGHPFLTPRPAEEAMRLAAAASFRSAAMGRQVGAALVPSTGTTVVVGTNEVPKPGGGQFWADDEPDFRDFQTGEDPNPVYVRRLLQDTLERLSEHGWLRDELSGLNGVELLARATTEDGEPAVLEDARAASLIEFTRCVHAEQAAILNAARAGISTAGSSLYSTTFPCHECAKLIIGAGIVEVQYIEPYPKSLVERLYRDLVDTAPPLTAGSGLVAGRVPFRAFQGIAPRRYDVVFAAATRRVGAQAAVFDRPQACPRTGGWAEETIEQRETTAIASMKQLLDNLSAKAAGVSATAADAQPVAVQDAPSEQVVGDRNAAGESA